MTEAQQRTHLQRKIWQIANDVRGSVDGWDFKQYVLGALFYRFISESFAAYMKGDDESINYATIADNVITDAIKENDYDLSVTTYVDFKDTREQIDIKVLNAELKQTAQNIDTLRKQINDIIAEIEGVN